MQNWKKHEIKFTGRQKSGFVMLSSILATVWLPPPSPTSYELARITFRLNALDQRLTKYFLTVRNRLTTDKPVLCYNVKNRTKFQESKSKPYTIILFIIAF